MVIRLSGCRNIYYLYYILQARMGAGIARGILKDGVKRSMLIPIVFDSETARGVWRMDTVTCLMVDNSILLSERIPHLDSLR